MNPINHVAIIMDGNGRWGIKNKNSRNAGHKAGLKTVEKIITESVRQKIKYLTLYTFSTENWKRPKKEINFLFKLLENFLENKIKTLEKNKIKLKIIGEKKAFSNKIKYLLNKTESETSKNNVMQINLALNYGSKNELINAVKNMIKKKNKINEENIKNNLYTPKFFLKKNYGLILQNMTLEKF
jgi:undecaprenyl diphosphate synthase